MTNCTQCGTTYEVNICYHKMIANLQQHGYKVVGHHFEVCAECLKKDDEYLNYCSSFFSKSGIDICIF
jgi:Fe2+ or Zn2+ uptake regulation protein